MEWKNKKKETGGKGGFSGSSAEERRHRRRGWRRGTRSRGKDRRGMDLWINDQRRGMDLTHGCKINNSNWKSTTWDGPLAWQSSTWDASSELTTTSQDGPLDCGSTTWDGSFGLAVDDVGRIFRTDGNDDVVSTFSTADHRRGMNLLA